MTSTRSPRRPVGVIEVQANELLDAQGLRRTAHRAGAIVALVPALGAATLIAAGCCAVLVAATVTDRALHAATTETR